MPGLEFRDARMNFILKMAWKDSRASRRRLLLFSFSVVLGIAALMVTIGFLASLGPASRALRVDPTEVSRAD